MSTLLDQLNKRECVLHGLYAWYRIDIPPSGFIECALQCLGNIILQRLALCSD